MNKLINIKDFEITKDKKLNLKSLYLVEALTRMKNKNKFHLENYEEVICPFELMLELFEVSQDFNEYRGNNNAIK